MSVLRQYANLAEIETDPWTCDVSRGHVQCKYVTPNGEGFLCCMYREGHETERQHHVPYLSDIDSRTWSHRPDLFRDAPHFACVERPSLLRRAFGFFAEMLREIIRSRKERA